MLCANSLQAQRASEAPPGVAWQVRGAWHAEGIGAPILTGDAILPGSLLKPGHENATNSITILLPDGQLVLCECFTAADCDRGFRVPSLYRRPEPFAIDMLARIHGVLVRRNADSSSGLNIRRESGLPRDEVVAVLDPRNQVHVEGLAAALPNGRYSYDLRPLDRAHPRQPHLTFEKSGRAVTLELPSAGLYDLTITDNLNTPRIDLFIAAIRPAQAENLMKSFHEASKLMDDWNDDYEGWPVHNFRRAYLESLMQGPMPPGPARQLNAAGKIAEADRANVTAEPSFLPRPGVLRGDTAVTLRCDTPGATIYYTVDGSQPIAGSPVYHAPIMVKGTELTITSFARAPGKKDSPVVTGIFRIEEQLR